MEVQDWVIVTSVALLMLRECIMVSLHLGQAFHLAGIAAASHLSSALAATCSPQVSQRLHRWQKALAFFAIGAAIFSVIGHAGPANAQFLQNAEDFFTDGANTFNLGRTKWPFLVSLIFWIIRGAFVISVAIGLLPAIQAAREGDEWRSLAKTPMLVVGIVLAGATSVDFLVGAGGGTPTP